MKQTQQPKKRQRKEKIPLETNSPEEEIKTKKAFTLPSLSSLQIVKILDHLVTLRSTVKTVSTSVQRFEDFVDSTYQLIEVANNFKSLPQAKKALTSPPKEEKQVKNKLPFSDDEIPVIELPKQEEGASTPALGKLLGKIDPAILLQIMNVPFIQKLVSQFNPLESKAKVETSQQVIPQQTPSYPNLDDAYNDKHYRGYYHSVEYYDPYGYEHYEKY